MLKAIFAKRRTAANGPQKVIGSPSRESPDSLARSASAANKTTTARPAI